MTTTGCYYFSHLLLPSHILHLEESVGAARPRLEGWGVVLLGGCFAFPGHLEVAPRPYWETSIDTIPIVNDRLLSMSMVDTFSKRH